MRKPTTALVVTAALGAAVIAAPSLHAQGNQPPSGSTMQHGMMGGQGAGKEGGMMGMMRQMSTMMDHCNKMMN